MLTPDLRNLFLQLLARGASPIGACQQMAISLASVHKTRAELPAFQQAIRDVEVALSQNVAAALYRAAMEGNVSAQTFWLKNRPPPGWASEEQQTDESDSFSQMTDDELIELARAAGIDLPPEITRTPDAESR